MSQSNQFHSSDPKVVQAKIDDMRLNPWANDGIEVCYGDYQIVAFCKNGSVHVYKNNLFK